ncbi:TPA: hypothetical protein N0F65_007943 [Lagenidium giganteum]|uniref:Chromatin modification-related protein EAF3 n=1 Tax=Lagenidium giganteum TaxID=4803 RepID=A0AAV2YH81_9STRA|nr:TPA: hypothetical protein N0F65_007943 [Lagenidium giganteum]
MVHGDMIYDAKVLKIDHGSGIVDDGTKEIKPTEKTQYYVHYQGWHKKWDEWATKSRIMEDNPESRKKQEEAKVTASQKQKEKRAAKKKKITVAGADPKAAGKSPFKKMRINAENDTEELPLDKIDPELKPLNIPMPFTLKKLLVEDWKHVTHEPYKLVPLPRQPSVNHIIKSYLEAKKAKVKGDPAEDKEYQCIQNIEGIMEGIQSYFDRSLGSILLYRMERKQYHDIRRKNEDVPLSEIYGMEHLVRLFVRLPLLLGSAQIPDRDIGPIQTRLTDFLKYLQKASSSWVLTDYELADDKYIEQALQQSTASSTSSPVTTSTTASSPSLIDATDAKMKPWWLQMLNWRLWAASAVVMYTAFQMHALPDPVARVVGRVFFYPTWPFTYMQRRNDYWTLMDSHVFIGAAPMSFMDHVEGLYVRGVRAVVNLCDEYEGPVKQYKKRSIQQLRLPTIDHTEPTMKDIEEAMEFIERHRQQGSRVYVHCKSGNGRSAAIVFCWLLKARQMTPLEAQLYMSEKRKVRKTLYQQPTILAYYDKLLAQNNATTNAAST